MVWSCPIVTEFEAGINWNFSVLAQILDSPSPVLLIMTGRISKVYLKMYKLTLEFCAYQGESEGLVFYPGPGKAGSVKTNCILAHTRGFRYKNFNAYLCQGAPISFWVGIYWNCQLKVSTLCLHKNKVFWIQLSMNHCLIALGEQTKMWFVAIKSSTSFFNLET